jgi:hypothetical protein
MRILNDTEAEVGARRSNVGPGNGRKHTAIEKFHYLRRRSLNIDRKSKETDAEAVPARLITSSWRLMHRFATTARVM